MYVGDKSCKVVYELLLFLFFFIILNKLLSCKAVFRRRET